MTAGDAVRMVVNGKPMAVSARTLADALVELEFVDVVVATALNGVFVPVRQRARQAVGAGDRIEIIAPMPGG